MQEGPSPGVSRSSFATADPASGEAFIEEAYGGGHVRFDGWAADREYRNSRVAFGDIAIDDVECAATYSAEVQASGVVLVFIGRSGHMQRRVGRVDEPFRVGEPTIVSDPGQPYSAVCTPARYGIVTLPPTLLARASGLAIDEEVPPLHFHSLIPVDALATEEWHRTVAHVVAMTALMPEVFAEPLVRDSAARLLATCLLAAFPTSYAPVPRLSDRANATAAMVRRAISYLETNAQRPVSVGDIAQHCRVSVRTPAVRVPPSPRHDPDGPSATDPTRRGPSGSPGRRSLCRWDRHRGRRSVGLLQPRQVRALLPGGVRRAPDRHAAIVNVP